MTHDDERVVEAAKLLRDKAAVSQVASMFRARWVDSNPVVAPFSPPHDCWFGDFLADIASFPGLSSAQLSHLVEAAIVGARDWTPACDIDGLLEARRLAGAVITRLKMAKGRWNFARVILWEDEGIAVRVRQTLLDGFCSALAMLTPDPTDDYTMERYGIALTELADGPLPSRETNSLLQLAHSAWLHFKDTAIRERVAFQLLPWAILHQPEVAATLIEAAFDSTGVEFSAPELNDPYSLAYEARDVFIDILRLSRDIPAIRASLSHSPSPRAQKIMEFYFDKDRDTYQGGVGPVCVHAELAPYLERSPYATADGGAKPIMAVIPKHLEGTVSRREEVPPEPAGQDQEDASCIFEFIGYNSSVGAGAGL